MEIQVENLCKSFDDKYVLRGITFNVKEGSVTAIIGGSGVGKTVLLKHIIGLLKPDEGRILMDGQDITMMSETMLDTVRKRFGMVFQTGGLLSSLSVGENVGLGLREHRIYPEKDINRIVSEKLEMVGMEGTEYLKPASLSGGMRKRVSIARALTMNPDTIIYDEPTTGLDPPMADTIDSLIKELSTSLDVTSILVTHDMHSVFATADTVYMLSEGDIVASGTPEEIRGNRSEIVRDFIHRYEAQLR